MTRRRFVLIAAILVLLACVLDTAVTYQRWPVNPERAYTRLRLGMKLDEAIAAIGLPPGNHDGGVDRGGFDIIDITGFVPPPNSPYRWRWQTHTILVDVGDDGTVVGTMLGVYDQDRSLPPTLFERLRAWLGF